MKRFDDSLQNVIRLARKHYLIVFTPKDGKKKRFLVSANQLYKYVGESNAYNCCINALFSDGDKYTIKLRKCGKLEFYVK